MKRLTALTRQVQPATLLAGLALFIVIGGTATAASGLINGNKIKKGTITAKQIKNKTITSGKLAPATIDSLRGERGPTGPAGAPGSAGPAGPTGPAGQRGADGQFSVREASASTVSLPTDTQTEMLNLSLPAGTYMLQAKALLISQGTSATNQIDCAIWTDGTSAVDLAREAPLAQNDVVTLPMLSVAEVAGEVTVRCTSDSGPAQASDVKLIAVEVAN